MTEDVAVQDQRTTDQDARRPLHRLVRPGSVVRVYRDKGAMKPLGRDPDNWSDEMVVKVDTHVIETQQLAKCSYGRMLPSECLFEKPNAVTGLLDQEHFDLLP